MDIKGLWGMWREFCLMEAVTIRLFGGAEAREAYTYFTQPHARLKLIPSKRFGVALLRLPDSFEQYLAGPERRQLRRHRGKALKAGYRFLEFAPLERLDEILAINASAAVRQDRPMRADYLDPRLVEAYFRPVPRIYGVTDAHGALRAYACTHLCGEVFTFSRLLGHAEDLRSGVMDLLISEVIRSMTERRQAAGCPLWAMYDTYFGSGEGLREYKKRLGFVPYRVRWLWEGAEHADR